MQEIVKIIVALVGIAVLFLILFGCLFTFIAILVPTSSPYQYEEWKNTVVTTILGINITQLTAFRLKVAAIGLVIILLLAAVAWFLWRLFLRL